MTYGGTDDDEFDRLLADLAGGPAPEWSSPEIGTYDREQWHPGFRALMENEIDPLLAAQDEPDAAPPFDPRRDPGGYTKPVPPIATTGEELPDFLEQTTIGAPPLPFGDQEKAALFDNSRQRMTPTQLAHMSKGFQNIATPEDRGDMFRRPDPTEPVNEDAWQALVTGRPTMRVAPRGYVDATGRGGGGGDGRNALEALGRGLLVTGVMGGSPILAGIGAGLSPAGEPDDGMTPYQRAQLELGYAQLAERGQRRAPAYASDPLAAARLAEIQARTEKIRAGTDTSAEPEAETPLEAARRAKLEAETARLQRRGTGGGAKVDRPGMTADEKREFDAKLARERMDLEKGAGAGGAADDKQSVEYGKELRLRGIDRARAALENVESEIGRYKDDVPGFGMTGMLPSATLSPQGKDLRRRVNELMDTKLRVATGAAAPPSEARTFREILGIGALSTDADLRAALRQVRQLMDIQSGYVAEMFPRARQTQKAQGGSRAGKTPVKKERSPSTGKVRITYSDGTQEIVDGG